MSRVLGPFQPVEDRAQVLPFQHAPGRLVARAPAGIAQVEGNEVEGRVETFADLRIELFEPLKPWTRTTVGAVGPAPFAAGTYQPATWIPSSVTTLSPALVPWYVHFIRLLFRAASWASSAMS